MLFPASIVLLKQLSSTVRFVRLRLISPSSVHGNVGESLFTFRPGQSVDLQIPGISQIGGYSPISTPRTLLEECHLDLSVKISDFPPSQWIHSEECQIGAQVHVGAPAGPCSFLWSPNSNNETLAQSQLPPNLLLLAGGVGVNPLYCIWKYCLEEDLSNRVYMLHCAQRYEDILFRDEIQNQVLQNQSHGRYKAQWFATREAQDTSLVAKTDAQCHAGQHINAEHIKDALNHLLAHNPHSLQDPTKLLCYICGPPNMIQAMRSLLHQMDISDPQILYEVWWTTPAGHSGIGE